MVMYKTVQFEARQAIMYRKPQTQFILSEVVTHLQIVIMWAAIKRQIDYEIERYSRTRYGKVAAFAIYCLIFTLLPAFLRVIVPILNSLMTAQHVYMVIIVGIVVGTTIVYNSVMYFVYTLKIPFFERYRCNPQRLWPWEEDHEKWRRLLWRSIKLTAFSSLIVLPLLLWVDTWVEFTVDMNIDNPPSVLSMMPYFLLFQLMQDIMFFLSHRLLHFPFLYKYHKVHHQYTTTVSIAGIHSHFVEFLISNTVTAGVYMKMAQVLLGPIHLNVTAIWTLLRMWDAYNGHSGYMFSWAPLQLLPFCASDDYHDFHHSNNCGNYAGQFRILDSIFGYNTSFWEYKQKQRSKISPKAA